MAAVCDMMFMTMSPLVNISSIACDKEEMSQPKEILHSVLPSTIYL